MFRQEGVGSPLSKARGTGQSANWAIGLRNGCPLKSVLPKRKRQLGCHTPNDWRAIRGYIMAGDEGLVTGVGGALAVCVRTGRVRVLRPATTGAKNKERV